MSSYQDTGAVIVGTGFMAAAHVDALRRLGIPLRGIVGRNADRAIAAARRFGIARAYRDLAEALGDDQVRVVHIVTPNSLHAGQVEEALRAGKHVVCEKPLATSTADALHLRRLAERQRVVHAVCFNVRYYPQCIHAEEIIREGELGAIRLVTGRYHQDWLARDTDWNWRLDVAQQGSLRAVADIGIHWLDLAQYLVGARTHAVFASLHTFVTARRRVSESVETFQNVLALGEGATVAIHSDDAASVLLQFENGAQGVASFSQVSYGRKNSINIQVDGSISSLAWSSEDPEHLWRGYRGRPNEVVAKSPEYLTHRAIEHASYPVGHVEGYPDTFRALFKDVYDDVVKGRPSETPRYPTFADGYEMLLVCDAIAESARTGKWTQVRRDNEAGIADCSVSREHAG